MSILDTLLGRKPAEPPAPPDPLAGLSGLRRKSVELALALPADVFEDLHARAAWVASYRGARRIAPNSPESVILDRRLQEMRLVLTDRGLTPEQAYDLVDLMVTDPPPPG